MVGVVFFIHYFKAIFLFFQKNRARKKYIGTILIYFIFPRKKRKIKKYTFIVIRFAATDERLYLCSVNVDAAWLETVPVLSHNQVDAGSSPAAATLLFKI